MNKQESLLENKIHTFSLDFETEMKHAIPATRPELLLINTKNTFPHLILPLQWTMQ